MICRQPNYPLLRDLVNKRVEIEAATMFSHLYWMPMCNSFPFCNVSHSSMTLPYTDKAYRVIQNPVSVTVCSVDRRDQFAKVSDFNFKLTTWVQNIILRKSMHAKLYPPIKCYWQIRTIRHMGQIWENSISTTTLQPANFVRSLILLSNTDKARC